MKKPLEIAKGPAKSGRRLRLSTVVITIAVLAIGAVTVISRQSGNVTEKPGSHGNNLPPPISAQNRYVTVKVAGQDVQVDSETGRIKELTPEEVAKLSAGLKQVINKSTDGLVEVDHPDGSVTMDLQGRFNSVTVARENLDGSLSESCVDNPQAAGAFFGIDPNLIEDQPNKRQLATPHRITPAKNPNK